MVLAQEEISPIPHVIGINLHQGISGLQSSESADRIFHFADIIRYVQGGANQTPRVLQARKLAEQPIQRLESVAQRTLEHERQIEERHPHRALDLHA